MTLVCNSFSMPSESYFSSGVDVLYPSQMMNPHQFPEPEWPSATSSLPRSPYQQAGDRTFPSFSTTMPQTTNDFDIPAYTASHRPPPIQTSQMSNNLLPVARPKSSPSTFGPNVEDLLFNENPFRIRTDDYPPPIFTLSPQSVPASAIKANSPMYPTAEYPASNPSYSPPRTNPITIAPDPIGLRNINILKRTRDDDDYADYGVKKQRKRAPSTSGPTDLNEEEQLLLKLKEEDNLPWKDIAVRFQNDLGKAYQVPALQMRFKRLRERMRTWTDVDVQALEQAYDYWEKFQFDIIAAKMLDFGASERWPAKHCARKWEEMHPDRIPYTSTAHSQFLRDPWDTLGGSPVQSSIGAHSPRATL